MHSPPLVLIVDDEQNSIILLQHTFEREGFVVESAEDGQTALKKARALHPDLILMDVQMPKMTGFEVTARLRKNQETARIPIIFVTAAARESKDVEYGFELGADDYIRKPFDPHELLIRARNKMDARQLEDRLQRRSDELEALVRLGGEFNQRLGLHELAELVILASQNECKADFAELYLFDEHQTPIMLRDTHGIRLSSEAEGRLAYKGTVAEYVFSTKEPLLINNTEQFTDRSFFSDLQDSSSMMAVPLEHHGRMLGILIVVRYKPEQFNEDNLRMLRSIGAQAALAIRNAQLHDTLQEHAKNLTKLVEARTKALHKTEMKLMQADKLSALGRLAAGIAHEINNPLQPILTCLEVAIEDMENNQPIDLEGLQIAEREVQRIKKIVTRLLDFSRSGKGEFVQVDVQTLIQEVLMLTKKQLEHEQIQIETRLTPVSPARGTPAQLKQVILNLILNAMESMPYGGIIVVETHSGFKTDSDEEGIIIVITDTGIGIEEKNIPKIFDPFFSTKDDGSGLGLSVSYGIIQGHEGDLQIESTPGVGSSFTIWLPYYLDSDYDFSQSD